jgi:hypothetical protein
MATRAIVVERLRRCQRSRTAKSGAPPRGLAEDQFRALLGGAHVERALGERFDQALLDENAQAFPLKGLVVGFGLVAEGKGESDRAFVA